MAVFGAFYVSGGGRRAPALNVEPRKLQTQPAFTAKTNKHQCRLTQRTQHGKFVFSWLRSTSTQNPKFAPENRKQNTKPNALFIRC